ncbi:MAG: hypothetical protein Q9O74_12165 [Planctomycetota bacterium]|nr:hypothetical protein [Planctomycetota bacterium]
MQITTITVRGGAGHFAEIAIERRDSESVVAIEIIKPDSNTMRRAPADDRKALWDLAAGVQETLDGVRGAGGDIRDYFELIERVANV